jgi:hypothetical protein
LDNQYAPGNRDSKPEASVSDSSSCPYCSKAFSGKEFERHIKQCEADEMKMFNFELPQIHVVCEVASSLALITRPLPPG